MFLLFFRKCSVVILGVALAGVIAFFISIQSARAMASLSTVFLAPASTSTVGTIRQVRVDPYSGKAYVLGNATARMGVFSADGSVFSAVDYSASQTSGVSADFAVSNDKVFVITNAGANGAMYRYDISGSSANLVANVYPSSGTGGVALTSSGTLYFNRGASVVEYDSSLIKIGPTSSVSFTPGRLAYGGGQLFYLSTAGRIVRTVLDGSDTTISTGGPTSANAKGFAVSSNGAGIYYASTTAVGKMSGASGTVFWSRSISNLAGVDLSPATGKITTIDTAGTVRVYDPINPVSGVTASVTGSAVTLNWSADVTDSDYAGATIRRGTGGYPANATDGTAVTSSVNGATYVDAGLSDGTYYYAIFNQTLDGYYGQGVTTSAVVDAPPDPVSSFTVSATGTTAQLSWVNPGNPDFSHVMLRRSTSGYPASIADGVTVSSSIVATVFNDSGLSDGSYYYAIFALDGGGNASVAATSSVIIDTTAPSAPVLSAVATGTAAYLSWDVPASAVSFLLRRSTLGPVLAITDGSVITSTNAASFVQSGLVDGTYYYGVFAADSYGNYSNPGTTSLMIDMTAPSTPSFFSAVASGNTIALAWVNPADADFSSSTVRRGTSTYPGSVTDGAEVVVTAATHFSDTGLSDGSYYYSIFAADERGNVSGRSTSSAMVDTYVPPTGPRIVAVPAPLASPVSGSGAAAAFVASPLPFKSSASVSAPETTMTDVQNNVGSQPIMSVATDGARSTIAAFKRTLQIGSRGNDVRDLQSFLNRNGFTVALSGAGSPGNETMVFGPATARALSAFQEFHAREILRPLGLKKGTGILGSVTIKIINATPR